jgi:hypothetical protein
MLFFPIVLASLWCAIAAELVVESARSGGRTLVFLGRVLAAPPPGATILILCVVSASAALAVAIVVSHDRERRLERRMAAELADRWRELDERWAQLAEREVADKARRELLSWRIGELQTLVDDLLAERRDGPGRHLVIVPDLPDNGDGSATRGSSRVRSRR